MGVQVNKFFLDKVLYHFPTAIAAIEEHGISSMLVQRPSEGCRIRASPPACHTRCLSLTTTVGERPQTLCIFRRFGSSV